ncbi:MAG: hypothetical protein HFH38_05700 [Lachnospiraceae bacterium]|nr:hypothetical protein [Lachnospiraceae bacterium]
MHPYQRRSSCCNSGS